MSQHDLPAPGDASGGAPHGGAPAPLLTAASLAFVQGLVVLVLAAAEGLSIDPERVGLGVSTTVFFAVWGLLLVVAARGLQRVRPWARGPVLLTQLIALALAWTFRDEAAIAASLLVAAVVTLGGLLHPRSLEALEAARD